MGWRSCRLGSSLCIPFVPRFFRTLFSRIGVTPEYSQIWVSASQITLWTQPHVNSLSGYVLWRPVDQGQSLDSIASPQPPLSSSHHINSNAAPAVFAHTHIEAVSICITFLGGSVTSKSLHSLVSSRLSSFTERLQPLIHFYRLVKTMTSVYFGLTDRPVFAHQISIFVRNVWLIAIRVSRNSPPTMIMRSLAYPITLHSFLLFLPVFRWPIGL